MLRQRKKFHSADIIRECDTFPKPNPKYTSDSHFDRSGIGGGISIVASLVIALILLSEIRSYLESHLIFKFTPDVKFSDKLKLNVDFTVAMPCSSIGADILDSTDQSMFMFGNLEEQDTWFRLSPEEEERFNDTRFANSYLREEFHAIHELLWKRGHNFMYSANTEREERPLEPYDACRLFGTLVLNKVAGNLHVSAGKALDLPNGHIHITAFTQNSQLNFSHRIHHFSFGDSSTGIIHPLDSDEQITDQDSVQYQYFIEVVPTDVETFISKVSTYQYSVKDSMRIIDHDKGSHGIPGIFFKYDMSSLRVHVLQAHEPLPKFLIRLFSTLAGIFIIAGILRDTLQKWFKKKLRVTTVKTRGEQVVVMLK